LESRGTERHALVISSPPGGGTTLRAAVPVGAAAEGRVARRWPSGAAR